MDASLTDSHGRKEIRREHLISVRFQRDGADSSHPHLAAGAELPVLEYRVGMNWELSLARNMSSLLIMSASTGCLAAILQSATPADYLCERIGFVWLVGTSTVLHYLLFVAFWVCCWVGFGYQKSFSPTPTVIFGIVLFFIFTVHVVDCIDRYISI